MLAAEAARTELVRLLIERGADPRLTDDTGATALDLALRGRPWRDPGGGQGARRATAELLRGALAKSVAKG
jgi:hypothetical protein